ncbi:hypothetical protein [Microbacterium sp. NPDC087591]|uniref:hypothetical protein n=1 Tax=Microbacterium sp. NPDC087591 TaxID=3364192 RepID=UPI003826D58B
MIGQALRAQARSFLGDRVLVWMAVAGFVMSLSLATSIPPDLADATAEVRESLIAPYSAVLAMYGGVLAAVYGSFRYTVDRRDGVIAQRLMLQPRWATLVARVPASGIGGAIVALAAVIGGHTALRLTMGGIPVDWVAVGATLSLGAASGLWGLGWGIVVRAHLVALFVTPLSLGSAVLVAMIWKAGAVYLPLLAMLEAFRFDVAALGIPAGHALDSSFAVLVTAGWVVVALVAGGVSFLKSDVR